MPPLAAAPGRTGRTPAGSPSSARLRRRRAPFLQGLRCLRPQQLRHHRPPALRRPAPPRSAHSPGCSSGREGAQGGNDTELQRGGEGGKRREKKKRKGKERKKLGGRVARNGQENGAIGRGSRWDCAYRIAGEWEQGEASHQLLHCFIQAGPLFGPPLYCRLPRPCSPRRRGEVKVFSVDGPRGPVGCKAGFLMSACLLL